MIFKITLIKNSYDCKLIIKFFIFLPQKPIPIRIDDNFFDF